MCKLAQEKCTMAKLQIGKKKLHSANMSGRNSIPQANSSAHFLKTNITLYVSIIEKFCVRWLFLSITLTSGYFSKKGKKMVQPICACLTRTVFVVHLI